MSESPTLYYSILLTYLLNLDRTDDKTSLNYLILYSYLIFRGLT